MKISHIHSGSGADLCLYHLPAKSPGKAKGVIQINHGMAEHAARYRRFATALSRSQYHVYAHDHRGHGTTKADDAPLGVFSDHDGWSKVIADTKTINRHIRKNHDGLPIIMFGHSMGSIITLNYCIHHSQTLDAAALWNSGVDGGVTLTLFSALLKLERMFKGSDVPSAVAKKFTFDSWNKKFAPNRTEFDWLSCDKAEVDKYIADPACGFAVSSGLWLDVVQGIRTGASNAALAKMRNDLPLYLLGGGADPCTGNGSAMIRLAKRLEQLSVSDISCIVHPDTRHEALNEINRQEITTDFIEWLDQRFG